MIPTITGIVTKSLTYHLTLAYRPIQDDSIF